MASSGPGLPLRRSGSSFGHMQLDPQQLSSSDRYKLIISTIVPRPIAWISTTSPEGVVNLAPFSYFGAAAASPPLLMVSIGRRNGQPKDTARNILATREAVVHIPDRSLAESMVQTSAELDSAHSELDLIGLRVTPSCKIGVPRLVDAKVAFECVLHQHLEVGDGPGDLFLLRAVYFHISDDILVDGLPDPAKLGAVGRLGGDAYCDTTAPFDLVRS